MRECLGWKERRVIWKAEENCAWRHSIRSLTWVSENCRVCRILSWKWTRLMTILKPQSIFCRHFTFRTWYYREIVIFHREMSHSAPSLSGQRSEEAIDGRICDLSRCHSHLFSRDRSLILKKLRNIVSSRNLWKWRVIPPCAVSCAAIRHFGRAVGLFST